MIAEAVNDTIGLAYAGEGEAACAHFTERAKRMVIRHARGDPGSCEELYDDIGGEREDDETFTADDVTLEDRVHGRPAAIVHDPYGGGMLMTKVDGEWLIALPGFVK